MKTNGIARELRAITGFSFLSGFVSTLAAIIAVLIAGYAFVIRGSETEKLINLYFKQHSPQNDFFATLNASINTNDLAGSFAVFFFWAMAGALSYALIASLYKAYNGGVDEVNLFQYALRKHIVSSVLTEHAAQLLIRLVVITSIFLTYSATTGIINFIARTTDHLAASKNLTLIILFEVGLFIGVLLFVQFHVVLARLFALRYRIFSNYTE